MSKDLGLHAQDRKIGDLFTSSYFYRIPEYQRPYSRWKDQANDFRNDLKDSDEWLPYFFGSFVFNKKEDNNGNRIDVIDGQQRLLTITIFLSVIRDISDKNHYDKLKDEIQDDYIHKESELNDEDDNPYKIIPWDTTKDYFKLIQDWNLKSNKAQTKEEKTIKSVYDSFYEKIEEDLSTKKNFEDKKQYLKWLVKLLKNASCIEISVTDDDIAYTIFETVNARWADLSVWDLVKNLFIKYYDTKNKKKDWIKLWKELESNISDCNWDISTFLRHYWLAKKTYISKKNLFKAIRDIINGSNYQELLEEITECSRYYKIVLSPETFSKEDLINILEINETKDIELIYKSLSSISKFKITQFSSIFISLLKFYKKLVKWCKPSEISINLEKFWYAFFGICSQPARAIEQECSKFATELWNTCEDDSLDDQQFSTTIQKIIVNHNDFLKKNFPNLDTFKGNFTKLWYKKSALTKYTLSKISKELEDKESWWNVIDYNAVEIEHILPQKPDQWWLKAEEVKEYVDYIWNLTLLSKKMNVSVGNKPLPEKTEDVNWFKISPIVMTKKLVEKFRETNYKWDEEEINKRGDELCRTIYEIQRLS